MVLNDEVFCSVAAAVGYSKSQYHGAIQDPDQPGKHLVKFLVYEGNVNLPTRGKFVWVNEDLKIVREEDNCFWQSIDNGPIELVVTPH